LGSGLTFTPTLGAVADSFPVGAGPGGDRYPIAPLQPDVELDEIQRTVAAGR
jgi:hypothetical protein